MNKRAVRIVILGALLCPAVFFTVWSPITAYPWLGLLGLLGASEAAIKPLCYSILAFSAVVAAVFVSLDLLGRTSRKSRTIRHSYSLLVIFLIVLSAVRAEAKRFKGWTPEQAALTVAWPSSAEVQESLRLRLDSEEQVPAMTRGPYRRYSVFDGEHLVCRVGISRRYGCYWVFGMREQLEDWKPNKTPGHVR